jgi:hypothetical protein
MGTVRSMPWHEAPAAGVYMTHPLQRCVVVLHEGETLMPAAAQSASVVQLCPEQCESNWQASWQLDVVELSAAPLAVDMLTGVQAGCEQALPLSSAFIWKPDGGLPLGSCPNPVKYPAPPALASGAMAASGTS